MWVKTERAVVAVAVGGDDVMRKSHDDDDDGLLLVRRMTMKTAPVTVALCGYYYRHVA